MKAELLFLPAGAFPKVQGLDITWVRAPPRFGALFVYYLQDDPNKHLMHHTIRLREL